MQCHPVMCQLGSEEFSRFPASWSSPQGFAPMPGTRVILHSSPMLVFFHILPHHFIFLRGPWAEKKPCLVLTSLVLSIVMHHLATEHVLRNVLVGDSAVVWTWWSILTHFNGTAQYTSCLCGTAYFPLSHDEQNSRKLNSTWHKMKQFRDAVNTRCMRPLTTEIGHMSYSKCFLITGHIL